MTATPSNRPPQADVAVIGPWVARFLTAPGHALSTVNTGAGWGTSDFDPAKADDEILGLSILANMGDVYLRVTTTNVVPEGHSRGSAEDSHALLGLWADLDHAEGCHKPDESLTLPPNRQACLDLLEQLPAPSTIIDTTGGLQVWWFFDRPQLITDLGGHEAASELTQGWHELVAGKAAEHGWHVDNVADLARILRIPGTLNHKWTKLDPPEPPRLVTIIKDDGPTYPLAVARELIASTTPADLLTPSDSPVHLKGESQQQTQADKPVFARDGEDLTWWEQRTSWEDLLCPHGWTVYQRKAGGEIWWTRPNADRSTTPKSAVTGYKGHDVLTVHTSASDLPSGPGQKLTKLRVFAHYHHGGDLEAAGKAVKAAWREEHPLPPILPEVLTFTPKSAATGVNSDDTPTVVQQPLFKSKKAYTANALRWLASEATRDDIPTVAYRDGEWWAWVDGCWRLQRDEDITDAMRAYFDNALTLNKDDEPVPFAPDNALMANMLTGLRSQVRRHGLTGDPWEATWIGEQPDGFPPASEIIPFKNGLLHWPTRKLLPHHARLWITHQLDCDWQANPGPPDAMLTMLEAQFGDDQESIEFLQEMAGYIVVGATWAEKLFGLIGAKRSGKSTFADALAAACGHENVTTMAVGAFEGAHGTSGLLGKKLIVLNETRTNGSGAGAVRDLLSISGGDAIMINRKYKDPISAKIRANILAHSNELPTFLETSGALAGRFLWVNFAQSFYGKEDPELKAAAVTQTPEFIEWALRGYERVLKRGRFIQPESGQELADDFESATSPVRRFVLETYEVGDMEQAERSRSVYGDYQTWCLEAGHKPLSEIKFAQAIRASFTHAEVRKGNRKRDGQVLKHWFGLRRREPRPVTYRPVAAF